jgi:hypothetical protein
MIERHGIRMKTSAVLLLAALSGCSSFEHGSGAERIDARTAFEALSGVEGNWSGEIIEGPWINEGDGSEGTEQPGEGPPVKGRYHVTAGGSVVEATLFEGTPRETVMMFHLVGSKLMLTQYGESANRTTLAADVCAQSISDSTGPADAVVRVGSGTQAHDDDGDVVAPPTSGAPDCVAIRFVCAGGANSAPSDGEYLHHLFVFVSKDMTKTWWTFFEDGAPARVVVVELTHKHSPQSVAEATPSWPPTTQ